MRFAVDIDDTVTKWPEEFKAIMESLKMSGHDVYMLTGGMDPQSANERYRENQLKKLGIERNTHYDDIHICVSDTYNGVAKLKGKFCKENEINVDFDDQYEYQDEIRKLSPKTMCLEVKG